MIVTTTSTIEGRNIVEYKGVVFGKVISGVNFRKDLTLYSRTMTGGRSDYYEDIFTQARQQAMSDMADYARGMGANAVVGVDFDYEMLGDANGRLMVTASGTAVVIKKDNKKMDMMMGDRLHGVILSNAKVAFVVASFGGIMVRVYRSEMSPLQSDRVGAPIDVIVTDKRDYYGNPILSNIEAFESRRV